MGNAQARGPKKSKAISDLVYTHLIWINKYPETLDSSGFSVYLYLRYLLWTPPHHMTIFPARN
ncbi:MAG TPA: hypothetical protein VNE41_05600 [Chitinophagaceae bacterium]|nr:hypothetical protein [Chitinophagaceae bacterium]